QKRVSAIPTLVDLDARFRILDRFDDYVQVLSLALPPVEAVASPGKSAELARIANEELSALVTKYPDRFAAGVAGLPLNDVPATLREIDHAVRRLGCAASSSIPTSMGNRSMIQTCCRFLRRWPNSMCLSGCIRHAAPRPPTIRARRSRCTKSGTSSDGRSTRRLL